MTVHLFPVAGGHLRRLGFLPARDSSRGSTPRSVGHSGRGLSSNTDAFPPASVGRGGSFPAPATIPGFVPLGTTMIGEKPDDIAAQTFGKAQTLKWLNAENDNG